ncbi:DNA polymerase/3'-5' exonuclease PolX [Patescibacteria group bacterium]|nr:DNA polymerase/3'-5' exonuclease PolX [Patescibacteria group bacterium]MBU1907423.1 DNA polymerase/3'-5' exonuclease PolX [Patescibacteria group bacterium]
MTNKEIAAILYEIADFLEMQEVAFKPRAYQRAAATVDAHPEELADLYKKCGRECIDDLPGIGVSISEKIEELIKTGRMKYYDSLKKKLPVAMHEMTQIESLGPKTIGKLYKKLKIRSIKDLEKAAKAGKIARVPGFGKKTEDNILEGIGFVKSSRGRFLLGDILPVAESIVERMQKVEGVKHFEVAGSIRRRKETIGDMDFVTTTTKPKQVIEAFTKLPEVKRVIDKGTSMVTVKFNNGANGDLRIHKDAEYGSALLHFTGSKYHNIQLRSIAVKKNLKLSEYGLFKGKKFIAGRTEESVYKKLGMQMIPPEMRTATGEIEAAQAGQIPKLIEYGSIKGDLQIQTTWSDGANSIEEMATAAKKLGLSYIAITDHTRALAMAGGLKEADLARQAKEIDKINIKLRGFKILKSAEVNILKDGSLDIKDEALARLDVVSVAVHSNFHLSEAEQTERIIRAIKHPLVNILFHPTGHIIKGRPGYALDINKIIKAAKQYHVALEVNAFPDRLDLRDIHIRLAVERKVKLVIDSDAHATKHLEYLDLGVAQARRGWAKRSDVLNTKSVTEFLTAIKKKRRA